MLIRGGVTAIRNLLLPIDYLSTSQAVILASGPNEMALAGAKRLPAPLFALVLVLVLF